MEDRNQLQPNVSRITKQQANDKLQLPSLLFNVIGQRLAVSDLYNYCQISKKVNSTCSNEKLWQSALQRDYRDLAETKPDEVTNLQWYRELKVNILKLIGNDIIELSINNGYVKLARWLFKQNFDLWDLDPQLLVIATKNGDYDSVKSLIKYGKTWFIDYAYIEAVKSNHYDIVKLLLETGVTAFADHSQAFEQAVTNNNYDMVKLLIDEGVDASGYGVDALIQAAGQGYYDIVKLLINNDVDVNRDGSDALVSASKNDHYDVVKLLLDNGAYVNAQGGTALVEAASNGNYDMVKLLIENGASIGFDAAIRQATAAGYQKIVDLLTNVDFD